MTLHAVGLADTGKALVRVSDIKLALGYTSTEGHISKGRVLTDKGPWIAVVAGDDIGQAPIVMDEVVSRLNEHERIDGVLIRETFRQAHRDFVTRKIEDLVLRPYGLTLSEFVSSGAQTLGDLAASEIRQEIRQVVISQDFIVYGFDSQTGRPHIYHVRSDGQIDDPSLIGYWAIGSGDVAAMHLLMSQDYRIDNSLTQNAYRLAAAKFFAEPADLGSRTEIVIIRHNEHEWGADIKQFREAWDQYGKPKFPPGLNQLVSPHESAKATNSSKDQT